MSQLSRLHENFIAQSERPMDFGRLPITAQQAQSPVVPMDRWQAIDGALHKTYRFRESEHRNEFIVSWLAYEHQTQHHARLTLDEGEVSLRLQTRDTQRITELDKEAARYADVLYKDLVSRPTTVTSSGDDQDADTL